jgi:hypothetical protein
VWRGRRDRLRIATGVGQYAAGEGHALITTRAYRAGTGAPGVICCGGRGASYLAPTEPRYRRIPSALAEAGLPVLSCQLGDGRTWGNDVAIDRIGDAVSFLTGPIGACPDGVILFAGSMGLLGALNWAARNRDRVLAVATTLPVVDLADVHDNDRGGFASEIEAAYGGRAGYEAAVAMHNPVRQLAALHGLPLRAWYSTDDPIAHPPALESFVSALGGQAGAVPLGPIGHFAGTTEPQEVVDFLVAATGWHEAR